MNQATRMDALYLRLEALGLDAEFVRSVVLPDWWDDEIAQNPAGYAQGLAIISRNLGIELRHLLPKAQAEVL